MQWSEHEQKCLIHLQWRKQRLPPWWKKSMTEFLLILMGPEFYLKAWDKMLRNALLENHNCWYFELPYYSWNEFLQRGPGTVSPNPKPHLSLSKGFEEPVSSLRLAPLCLGFSPRTCSHAPKQALYHWIWDWDPPISGREMLQVAHDTWAPGGTSLKRHLKASGLSLRCGWPPEFIPF